VITGPGLTNIMTPMGQAYSDSVPMLVISSCLDETAATRGQLHQMKDQRAAAEMVCDWSEEARTPEAVFALIDRALLEFETKRKRPKHIQVPIAALQGVAAPAPARPPLAGQCDAGAGDVERIVDMIAGAARPVLVFGGAASTCQTHTGLNTTFAETVGAAVFTTYAGRGAVSPDLWGFCGSTLARPASREIFAQADLVICLGTDIAEVDLWRSELGHEAPLVSVNVDSTAIGLPHAADHVIVTDINAFMNGVLMRMETRHITAWDREEFRSYRNRMRAEVDAEYPGVLTVSDALRACLPDDTMIYSDMTQFAYASKEVWDMNRPGHWHHPYGFGTLGYALPAAIGGAVGRDGKPTLAIAGDYGFQYTVQELGTAVELELPIPIILWDNGKLGAIEASMIAAQIAPNAVIARNPDFCKLAEAYGAYAARPASLTEMAEAVNAAFSADRPTLVHLTPSLPF
jgi:acetolactate synthase-1/2/3 large subunit/5-guanidino-2-oxopentanoate decarboxylase